jgi:hypothetical protein
MQIKFRPFFFVIFISSAILLFAFQPYNQDNLTYITNSCAAVRKVQTLSFLLEKRERINGVLIEQRNNVKFQKKPLKVYMKQDFPNKGMEVLFVENTNNNKLAINPNGFPWVTLNLDPFNNKVRQNQHHTIYEAGFEYVVTMVETLLNKHKDIAANVKLDGTVVWDNRECHKIIVNNPHFKYIDYTVKPNETLNTIAKAKGIGAYMIMDKNPTIKDYEAVKAGQVIKIPTEYALKFIFYLDKQNLMPVVIKVYDDLGLYEEYKYSKLQINPKFDSQEFTKTYQQYKF